MLQFFILMLILLLVILYIFRCEYENFGVVNNHILYMKYRDYIDGIDYGYLYDIPIYNKNKIRGLRKISGNCFVDKMRYCSKNNDLCVQQSSLKCLGPPMVSGTI